MMKFYFSLVVCALVALPMQAQKTVKMTAVKGNDFGVAYSLPKTAIKVTAACTKTSKKAGEFYKYAERYLNITNAITNDDVTYTLTSLDATTVGVVDKEKSYLVEFRPNSAASFLTLTQDGLLCAINEDYIFPKKEKIETEKARVKEIVNPRTYLSEEALRAGSSVKQAELVAKQIYRLRESKNDILMGDADNMPPDGDAYKLVMAQLDEQERALTEMFIGTSNEEVITKEFDVVISEANIINNIVARISSKLGFVASDDLAGEPIYLNLTNLNPHVAEELTPKELSEIEKKFSQGIIYNIPSKASLEMTYRDKKLVDKEFDIVQYGVQDVLSNKKFGDKNDALKVVFYPELGAIKQTGLIAR